MLGAGDAFMSGFLRGWLRDEPLETCCAFANAGGAFAVSRLLMLGGISDLSRDAALHRQGIVAQGRALRRGAQPHPLGDDAPRRGRPDHGARHRSPRAARKNRRRRRRPARAHRRVQAAGGRSRRARRQGAAGLRDAARRQIRARGFVPRRRAGLLDRPPGRGAGLAPARFRVRRLARRQADRMAGQPHDQVPVLLPARRCGGDEGAPGARASAPLRRRAAE